MSIKLQSYKLDDGSTKTVLVNDKGYKHYHVLIMTDKGLVVRRVPKIETQFFSDPIQSKKVPAATTLIKRYRSFGKRVGMTKQAKAFLREAAHNT